MDLWFEIVVVGLLFLIFIGGVVEAVYICVTIISTLDVISEDYKHELLTMGARRLGSLLATNYRILHELKKMNKLDGR
jgi:hypothetical protein